MFGLHVVQCFIDALVTEKNTGSNNASELLDLLTSKIDEGFSMDADIEQFNKLLIKVCLGGSFIVQSNFSQIRSMVESDTRIVWTNDRNSKGKLDQDSGVCCILSNSLQFTPHLLRMPLLDCC